MATLKVCLVQFLNGFKDSLVGSIKFFQRQNAILAGGQATRSLGKKQLSKNDKFYTNLIQSSILNGVFLFLCICIFNYILMPVLNSIAFTLISASNHNLINNYLNPCFQILFSSVWILPVFLLCKLFNLIWHQEIADIAYEFKYGKPKSNPNQSFSDFIADMVFSVTMQLIFLVQSSLMGLIPAPWLSTILGHFHTSFLYALYAFEYKLCNRGLDIRKRIEHIELRWPYFWGFGLSMSLILSVADAYIYNAALFGFIFPAFILSAIESDSEKLDPVMYLKRDINSQTGFETHQFRIKLFKISIYVTDYIFKIFNKKEIEKLKQKNSKPIQQQNFTIRKTN